MSDPFLGWWFCPNNRRLANNDGRPIVVGETLTVSGEIVLCQNGLHASRRALDALQYAPGEIVCCVRLSGTIVEEQGKAAASERTVLAMADAGDLLHEFACWGAEQSLLREREQGREPDPRCWEAIEMKRRWLKGKITDEQLAAAMAAARAAAREAAWVAAWAAARAAAREDAMAAARAAAMASARAAAWEAAWAAAWEAAWASAREAAMEAAREAAMEAAWAAAMEAAREDARAAAWEDAWEAAWAAQNKELENRLYVLLGLND